MFKTCSIVVTQENDMFCDILHHLKLSNNSIKGILYMTNDKENPNDKENDKPNPVPSVCRRESLNQNKLKSWDDRCHEYSYEMETFQKDCCNRLTGTVKKQDMNEYKNSTSYHSCDGIGVYWDSAKVSMMDYNEDTILDTITTRPSHWQKLNNDGWLVNRVSPNTDWIKLNFTHNGIPYHLYPVHLKSGETLNGDEEKNDFQPRYVCINNIIESIGQHANSIIIGDFNESEEYVEYFNKVQGNSSHWAKWSEWESITATDLLHYHGFEEATIHEDNKLHQSCVKLRHAYGNQEKKYGALMVDRIDHAFSKDLNLDVESLIKTDLPMKKVLFYIRKDPVLRDVLRSIVYLGRINKNDNSSKTTKLTQLLENERVIKAGDRFDDYVSKIHAMLLNKSAVPRFFHRKSVDTINEKMKIIMDILAKYTYPNKKGKIGSDHPPIIVSVKPKRVPSKKHDWGIGPNMKKREVETKPIPFEEIRNIIGLDPKINVIILCKKRVKTLANNTSFKVILTSNSNTSKSVERRVIWPYKFEDLYTAFLKQYCGGKSNRSIPCHYHIYKDYCDFFKMSRNSVHYNSKKTNCYNCYKC